MMDYEDLAAALFVATVIIVAISFGAGIAVGVMFF